MVLIYFKAHITANTDSTEKQQSLFNLKRAVGCQRRMKSKLQSKWKSAPLPDESHKYLPTSRLPEEDVLSK